MEFGSYPIKSFLNVFGKFELYVFACLITIKWLVMPSTQSTRSHRGKKNDLLNASIDWICARISLTATPLLLVYLGRRLD